MPSGGAVATIVSTKARIWIQPMSVIGCSKLLRADQCIREVHHQNDGHDTACEVIETHGPPPLLQAFAGHDIKPGQCEESQRCDREDDVSHLCPPEARSCFRRRPTSHPSRSAMDERGNRKPLTEPGNQP